MRTALSPADNERMYAFLKKHLVLDAAANTTETAVPPVPCKQLTVTRTGQLASDRLSGAVFLPDIVREAAEALERKRAAERSGEPHLCQNVQRLLAEVFSRLL